jgi:hypothetical protein
LYAVGLFYNWAGQNTADVFLCFVNFEKAFDRINSIKVAACRHYYSTFMHKYMTEAIERIEEGIQIGGNLLKDVRFADDQGNVNFIFNLIITMSSVYNIYRPTCIER